MCSLPKHITTLWALASPGPQVAALASGSWPQLRVWAGGWELGVWDEAGWGPQIGSPGLGTGSGQGGFWAQTLRKVALKSEFKAVEKKNSPHKLKQTAWLWNLFPWHFACLRGGNFPLSFFVFITALLKYNSPTVYYSHVKGTRVFSMLTAL